MSGTQADGSVEDADGEAGQLVITFSSAAVLGAVVDWLRARWGRDRDRRINVRYHRSFISGRSSRNYLDDQGRSHAQEEKNLIFRSGSPTSGIARVPECNSTG